MSIKLASKAIGCRTLGVKDNGYILGHSLGNKRWACRDERQLGRIHRNLWVILTLVILTIILGLLRWVVWGRWVVLALGLTSYRDHCH